MSSGMSFCFAHGEGEQFDIWHTSDLCGKLSDNPSTGFQLPGFSQPFLLLFKPHLALLFTICSYSRQESAGM